MMQNISINRDEPKCLPKTNRTNFFYKKSTILLATQTNGKFSLNVKLRFKNIEFRYWILLFFNFAETSSWKYFFM